MKKSFKYKVVTILCAVPLAMAFGVDLEKPTANLTEKFADRAGWTTNVDAGVAAGWTTNQDLTVQFPSRIASAYLPQIASFRCDTNASGGRFSGDFSLMESLSFDVTTTNLQETPAMYFVGASGTKWRLAVAVPQNTGGQRQTILVPLTFNDDPVKCWSSDAVRTSSDDFSADKRDVKEIGFETLRTGNGNFAQKFVVDNVKLLGPWSTNLVDGVPLAWALEYGLTNNPGEVGRSDTDGDGFTNVAEFLAGTDPNNSSDYFRVDIGVDESGRTVVKWKDNKYMKFDLLESSDLVTFSAVPDKTDIQGVGTQQVVEVNSAGVVGARFYKVQIRQ